MSSVGAALGVAVPISNARAEASRKNGAKSRGPKTAEGKARSAQNALRHGMRALRYVVLPDEDGVEFAALEAALVEELAPTGALQIVLARRVAMAAWRLARADRMEVELFAERRWENAGVGMALIRYRGAAMAEFWRALKTLKAFQAEARADAAADLALALPVSQLAVPTTVCAQPPRPGAPEDRSSVRTERTRAPARCGRGLEYVLPDPSGVRRTLHEPAAPWIERTRGPDERV